MSDLNTMMREQARNGLQVQLDAAVTNGDAEAARKITADLEKLAVATAPKAPPYGNTEITAELDKQPWFGIDPKKSARVVELGKSMNPKKFGTAAEFAAALVKAVDEEFKVVEPKKDDEDPDDETGDEDPDGETGDETPSKSPKKRASDGPNDADTSGRVRRTSSGPWKKISDAPADIQKEVNRAADKLVSSNAPKEQREKFVAKALESHYANHLRKGKK